MRSSAYRRFFALVLIVVAIGAPVAASQAAEMDAREGAIKRTLLQTDPCDAGSAAVVYACPALDEESAEYIEYVRAVGDEMVILLTTAGIALGNECGGAATLVEMAHQLYERIPEGERSASQIDWTGRQLEDEFYAHAYFASLPEDASFFGIDFAERGNPINIEFADYTDLESRDSGDVAQQVIFRLLGNAKRAECDAARTSALW